MKVLPISFSNDMIDAERVGRKNMTRRTSGFEEINNNPDFYIWLKDYPQLEIPRKAVPYDDNFYYAFTGRHDNSSLVVVTCPYGKPGDILWVKESYFSFGKWTAPAGVFTKTGRQKFVFVSENEEVRYLDSAPAEVIGKQKNILSMPRWYKRLARFMPRKYCRTFLKIISVSIERLHDISEQDAINEGILIGDEGIKYFDYLNNCYINNAKNSFQSLWVKINGQDKWDCNPWVWVISFMRTTNPFLNKNNYGKV